jgi:hypothetical protein
MAIEFIPTTETLSCMQGFNLSIQALGPADALKYYEHEQSLSSSIRIWNWCPGAATDSRLERL